VRISLAIPRPPEGACPCCYSKWVLREVESLALECLRAYYDEHPPALGDACGQTPEAAIRAAEAIL